MAVTMVPIIIPYERAMELYINPWDLRISILQRSAEAYKIVISRVSPSNENCRILMQTEPICGGNASAVAVLESTLCEVQQWFSREFLKPHNLMLAFLNEGSGLVERVFNIAGPPINQKEVLNPALIERIVRELMRSSVVETALLRPA